MISSQDRAGCYERIATPGIRRDLGQKCLAGQIPGNVEELITEVIENTKFPTRQGESVLERINEEHSQLGGSMNRWLVYNGFNYQLNHNTDIGTADHKKDRIDEQVLDYLLTA